MHQPDLAPRRSIYYDYRIHAAAPRPDVTRRHAVVVVGAGPIGLATALDLARFGVPVLLLESECQVSEGSRALAFTRRSMEILQQVGVAARIGAMGLPWRFGNSFYRGRRVFRLEVPHDDDDRFFPMINIQQQYLEEFMVDAVAAEPAIEMRWGHRVTAIERNDDLARLVVDTPEGEYRLEADWVVACDGARSPLRAMLDLRMEGDSFEGRFVIADIRADLDLPTERLCFFDPPWNPGNTVLMHREPHGLWRVDYQLPRGESPEEALRFESLKARIDAQLASIGKAGIAWELDWCSVYSARAMTLPDYFAGRIVFCGDAAHMLPIFGVRGANTGWQDGNNLAWKLALAIRGVAGSGLLASYSAERVTAAREIVDEASKSTRFMTPPTAGYRLLRDAALSLALSQEFARPLLHWRTSRPHDYFSSALNCPGDDDRMFTHGPADGMPLSNVRLRDDDFLFDHLGAAFHLLAIGGVQAIPADIVDAVAALRGRGVPIRIVALAPAGQVEGADLCLADPEGRARKRYGVGRERAWVLARPDQHVCARWLNLDGDRLSRAVAIALGHAQEEVPQ